MMLERLAQHSLPTSDVLDHRNIADSPHCPLCGMPDSWRHTLVECTMARCVWALANEDLLEHMIRSTEPQAKQWLFTMQSSLSHVEFTELVVTLWAIWFARRKAIYDHEFQPPLSTHSFIKNFISELHVLAIHKTRTATNTAPRPRRLPWLRPPAGVPKLNVDGAVLAYTNRGAAAVVCRDEHGHYLGSSAVTFEGVLEAPVLEAIGCREALALAKDLHLSNILISSDCQNVINDTYQNSNGHNGAIIKEIRVGFREFESCNFIYESRSRNFEADSLAKFSLPLDLGRHVWLVQSHDVVTIHVDLGNE